MAEDDPAPCTYVLAGCNGAGKSSIAGAMMLRKGAVYFNPDEAARQIRSGNPRVTQEEANSAAWYEGKRLLERAITERLYFAFETTLGGRTMPALLENAIARGIELRIWFAALNSPELHIARVRARVKKGGHDIPEADIRRRYDSSRRNLIHLLPKATELRVYDNSDEGDPDGGRAPQPRLVLHVSRGKVLNPGDLHRTPEWAKAIVAAALKLQ